MQCVNEINQILMLSNNRNDLDLAMVPSTVQER